MKKLFTAIVAAIAGFALVKKLTGSNEDQELWTQADSE